MTESLEQQSLRNHVRFFEEELRAVNDGASIYDLFSYHTRKKMIKNGILTKRFRKGSGPRFFLTDVGMGMLK